MPNSSLSARPPAVSGPILYGHVKARSVRMLSDESLWSDAHAEALRTVYNQSARTTTRAHTNSVLREDLRYWPYHAQLHWSCHQDVLSLFVTPGWVGGGPYSTLRGVELRDPSVLHVMVDAVSSSPPDSPCPSLAVRPGVGGGSAPWAPAAVCPAAVLTRGRDTGGPTTRVWKDCHRAPTSYGVASIPVSRTGVTLVLSGIHARKL